MPPPPPLMRERGLNIYINWNGLNCLLNYLPPPVREPEEVREPEDDLDEPELLVEPEELPPELLVGGETVVRVPDEDLPLLLLPTDVADLLVLEEPTLTVVVLLLLLVLVSGRTYVELLAGLR